MGEDNQGKTDLVTFEHLKGDNTTMDDGGSNAGTEQGRSRESRAESSHSRNRTKSNDPRGPGSKADGRSTSAAKRRGRPPGSKNKKRSQSRPRVTPQRSTSTARKQRDDKTPPEKAAVVDLSGPDGRVVKQEIMETLSKIQQTRL